MAEQLGVVEKLPILKKTRAPTGIADLDIIMEGGYQNPGNIMFVGPTGLEKNFLGLFFYRYFVPNGTESGLFTSPE